MIPIKDSPRAQRFPFVNIAIILANAVVFYLELTMGPGRLEGFINHYGLVPTRLMAVDFSYPASVVAGVVPLFTSMFIHAGWIHVIGNLLFLWIFGDNVEDRLGHVGYLIFYVLCGVAAGLAHAFLTTIISGGSAVPTIGASGAIAGVMGAYLVLYPRAKVLTLIPVIFYAWFIEVPAWIYLGIWVLIQLFTGALDLAGATSGVVAWWAHVGGFVAGLILICIFPKCRRHRYQTAP
jgi:membrane associated rhomboid family serine protease